MEAILFVLVGYLFGSFQSSYIFVKLKTGKDIRNDGSQNAGTANTFVLYGKAMALAVLFFDMMKTFAASLVCLLIAKRTDPFAVISLSCLGATLGHNFPFWLSFKGGKGVACAAAFALALDVRIFFVSIIVAAMFAYLLKSLTYGAFTFAMMLFVSTVDFGYETVVALCVLAVSLMVVLLHFRKKKPIIASS